MVISFYLVVAIVCALLLIIMAAFADFGGDAGIDGMDFDADASLDMDGGVDVDVDGGYGDFHGAGITPLSIPVVLVFGTLFGSFGAFFESVFDNAILVPTLAALIGVAITAVVYVILVKVFVKTQATTQVHLEDLINTEAESTMPIKPGAPGQIMVITEARGRTLVPAVSDEEIPTNTIVTVTGVVGNGVRVKKKSGGE